VRVLVEKKGEMRRREREELFPSFHSQANDACMLCASLDLD
jgi:hypothetical protein